jgi:hypothetical protein
VAVNYVNPQDAHFRGLWSRHFEDSARERAFLSAVGFNVGFLSCRVITHAIRAGVGPFRNMSAGGRHLHHSTFGIFGLIGIGYAWSYQWAIGTPDQHPLPSRVSATLYGIATALTLDEFALWFDLHDDYWTPAGRKSVDAAALFGSLATAGVVGRSAVHEFTQALRKSLRRDHTGVALD